MKFVVIVTVCIVVFLGLLAGTGFIIYRSYSAAPETTRVRVEYATTGPLVELVSVPGEIQPRTKVSISSRVAARIAELPHVAGESVKKTPPGTTQPTRDMVLVRLDSKDLESALRSAEARAAAQSAQIRVAELRIEAQKAQVVASKATLADAMRDMKRKRELALSKDISQAEADTSQTRADELQAQLVAAEQNLLSEEQNVIVQRHQQDASEADIARARDELAYTVITSPIDGVITRIKAEVGEQVVPGIQGSVGSAILEVADLSQMLMVARVDEANINAVKVGQKATVRIQAYRDRTFEGVVESVALAKADPSAGNSRSNDGANYYEAKILLKTDSQRIPTGLNADADIETHRYDGIRVPSQAVLSRPVDGLPEELKSRPEVGKEKSSVTVVYLFRDGKAVVVPVKVGASDETHTLILTGLKGGEPVITGPFKALDTLANGQVAVSDGASIVPTTQPVTRPATQPTTQSAAPATTQSSTTPAL